MIKKIMNYLIILLFVFSIYEYYRLKELIEIDINVCKSQSEIKSAQLYKNQKQDSYKYLVDFQCCPYSFNENQELTRKCQ